MPYNTNEQTINNNKTGNNEQKYIYMIPCTLCMTNEKQGTNTPLICITEQQLSITDTSLTWSCTLASYVPTLATCLTSW